MKRFAILFSLAGFLQAEETPPWPILGSAKDPTPLPGTAKLEMEGDLAWELVSGVDKFLDKKINETDQNPTWPDYTTDENRKFFSQILGTSLDPIHGDSRFEYTGTSPGPIAETGEATICEVRWKAFRDVHGTGLLLEPKNEEPIADVVAIPDAGQTPEEVSLFGKNPFALRMAQAGCRVVVPMLTNRENHRFPMTNREWLHRPAFELGRTLAGYETNMAIAAIHCLEQMPGHRKTFVCGWGEGGRIAFYVGALLGDSNRLDGVCVSGYFGSRKNVWNEPAERNVFHLLSRFGDAGVASLVRCPLVIEHSPAPGFTFRADADGEPEMVTVDRPKINGGKPGKLIVPDFEGTKAEFDRIRKRDKFLLQSTAPISNPALERLFLEGGCGTVGFQDTISLPTTDSQTGIQNRHDAQLREIEAHNTWALTESAGQRDAFFSKLNTATAQSFDSSVKPYRKIFRDEVIGSFEETEKYLPPNPRTRQYQTGPKTVSYEVVLDVYEDVIAYGILTLPKNLDLESGKKLPVVVCQHGLEGRPQDTIGEQKYTAYKAYATRLAEEGFITFAPQNLYIFRDKFRLLQFKANSIGKTLFSVMVPQHKVITKWLASLPYVDGDKIGFYGLSYGGKSAMRIPPLVERYCLSICSGDFNEWIWKICATDPKSLRYTYVNKGEYEIFEFNLGNTFNYAEMAALIAPRPFMVERGHFDGVAPDETVAYEYAKVRRLYAAKLGIPDKTEIEWFAGPHCINGKGTFEFLKKHLMVDGK